ncbi:GNAT family N-acetyltransferase [Bacillus mojavensis]|uniref:GNAT family N-acetyltransferase n=1 Tax=Bacillus mojavensis TaxID=72360 RepID=A0AAP3CNN4_BACMO|nr:GNAT family N-acetyltransferase [Bacillus mojavensis]MCY8508401.1 GNAT family N-acetyltransferase [Bacillus mojavensis]
MYTIKENVSQEAIMEFLQSKQMTLDGSYQFSLGLFENSQLQGVMLYEDALWESKMLQKKVMNVKLLVANSTGQLKQLFQALYSVRQMAETDFVFVRVPAEDIGAVHVIQQQPSSYFVGSLLKLVNTPSPYEKTPPFFELVQPEPGDTEEICQLASDAFAKSRYFHDPYLSREAANKIFQEWTRNNLTGRADINIAAKYNGEMIGYLQGLSKGDEYVLDLMAVKPGYEGKRVAFHLLAHLIEQPETLKHKTVTAGTQLHNVRAIRLYERMGFTAVQSYYNYHIWPGKKVK